MSRPPAFGVCRLTATTPHLVEDSFHWLLVGARMDTHGKRYGESDGYWDKYTLVVGFSVYHREREPHTNQATFDSLLCLDNTSVSKKNLARHHEVGL